MNSKSLSLYLLAGAVLAGSVACDGHRERRTSSHAAKKTIERSWPAAGIDRVKVAEIDGSVRVEAIDGDQITMIARVSGDYELKQGVENDGLFETRVDGDTLRIGRQERKRGRRLNIGFLFGRDEIRVDYELRVPRSVSLAVSTVNGRISTRGENNRSSDLVTVNGTIDAETSGMEELRAVTVNGRVKARFLKTFQGAQFRTVNGGVEAHLPQSASFNVDLSQLNGDFEAEFPLSIHSNPGSRRVSGEVNGGQHSLKITTVNGDVELGRLTAVAK
ncbi:MAG TPA: DUF4097 family beta strand repeat-containing protein [Thermoanaerobaculia bacterium]|jgi:hypothetical protein